MTKAMSQTLTTELEILKRTHSVVTKLQPSGERLKTAVGLQQLMQASITLCLT